MQRAHARAEEIGAVLEDAAGGETVARCSSLDPSTSSDCGCANDGGAP